MIVGVLAFVIGAVSVITCFGKGVAIINTGSGNGVNAIVSIITAFVGIYIYRSGNTMAALLLAMLFASLLFYGNYRVDGQRAVNVVAAAGSAAVSAASSAVTAAGSAASNSISSSGVSGSGALKPGHRWLTSKEVAWCHQKGSKSKGCVTSQCAIKNCGTKGK